MYLDRLNKMKEDIEKQIQSYQQPINNIITTQQLSGDLYEVKKLNDNDEVENIFVNSNTIFLGTSRMQIKKLDGTVEKYKIEKYYPVDERDEMIKKLNEKVEELERKLNDEHTKSNEPIEQFDKSNANDDGNVESKSKNNG